MEECLRSPFAYTVGCRDDRGKYESDVGTSGHLRWYGDEHDRQD